MIGTITRRRTSTPGKFNNKDGKTFGIVWPMRTAPLPEVAAAGNGDEIVIVLALMASNTINSEFINIYKFRSKSIKNLIKTHFMNDIHCIIEKIF